MHLTLAIAVDCDSSGADVEQLDDARRRRVRWSPAVADTVKVQWNAYLGAGSLLLSDMGRVLMRRISSAASPFKGPIVTWSACAGAVAKTQAVRMPSKPTPCSTVWISRAYVGLTVVTRSACRMPVLTRTPLLYA